MRFSPDVSGRFLAAVEQFVGALSLCQPVRLGGWIVGRGESGHRARAVGLGSEIAWNGGQRIIDLLFGRRCLLISNGFSSHYLSFLGRQVVISGGWASSKQGGEGARAARWPGPYNPLAAAKFVPIARGPKIGLQKRRGRGRLLTTTQHGTQL